MSSDCLSSVCCLCCRGAGQTIIILSIPHMLGEGNQRHHALESIHGGLFSPAAPLYTNQSAICWDIKHKTGEKKINKQKRRHFWTEKLIKSPPFIRLVHFSFFLCVFWKTTTGRNTHAMNSAEAATADPACP